MAASSDVSAGDVILASAYNSLRADVLNTSTGHTHNGTDAKSIAVDDSTIELSGGTYNIKDDGVTGAKLAPAVAGDGIKQDGSGNLDVDVSDFAGTGLEDDGSENIRIAAAAAGDGLQGGAGSALAVDVSDFAGTGLEDDGSENIRIAAAAAGNGLAGGAGSALSVNVDDSTIEINSDILRIKDGGVGANKLGTGATFNSAVTRYWSVNGAEAIVSVGARGLAYGSFHSSSNTDQVQGVIPVHLPHGAVVTSFKVYWYRSDAAASGEAFLTYLVHGENTTYLFPPMATANSDASSGDHSVEDTSIVSATIDNDSNVYFIFVTCDPNDNATEVQFTSAKITYTITAPLP